MSEEKEIPVVSVKVVKEKESVPEGALDSMYDDYSITDLEIDAILEDKDIAEE